MLTSYGSYHSTEEARDVYRNTPLQIAACNVHLAVSKLLIEHGAIVHACVEQE
jgi:ankyrin repeat protein